MHGTGRRARAAQGPLVAPVGCAHGARPSSSCCSPPSCENNPWEEPVPDNALEPERYHACEDLPEGSVFPNQGATGVQFTVSCQRLCSVHDTPPLPTAH